MSGAQRPDRWASWRVRILGGRDGEVFGAGVLISESAVVTCAHVVADSLGVEPSDDPPEAPVRVDFAASQHGPQRAIVRPGGWFPPRARSGDVAILDLKTQPPSDVMPARLSPSDSFRGRAVAAFGYPRSAPNGLWAEARVIGRGGNDPEWEQLDGLLPTGGRIEKGYSGAGVTEQASDVVIGIVVAEYTATAVKTAWMLPTEALATYWPPLHQMLACPTPTSDRLSPMQVEELSGALLAVPALRDPQARQVVQDQLRPAISAAVPYSPRAQVAVLSLVRTCLDYDGGLAELLGAVRLVDRESAPSRAFQDIALRILRRDIGCADGS